MKQSIFLTIYQNGFVIAETLFNDDETGTGLEKCLKYLKIQKPTIGFKIEMEITQSQIV